MLRRSLCSVQQCFLLLLALALSTIVLMQIGNKSMEFFYSEGSSWSLQKDFNSTIACKFPQLDPMSAKARTFYTKYPTKTCPDGLTTVTFYDGKYIQVNKTLKERLLPDTTFQCFYRTVSYKVGGFKNGPWVGPFTRYIQVTENPTPEYVEVICNNTQHMVVSKMHHYAVRSEQRKDTKPVQHAFKEEQMNVLMVGMDSVSSHLFKRAMPKTRQLLLEIGAAEMNAYNRIGENTYPNLIALCTGKHLNELPENKSLDGVPFIWSDFKQKGYQTQYMSDRPDFRTFSQPPTDSFNFAMSHALMKDMKDDLKNSCFEDQVEVELWLNLIKEFVWESIYKTGRFFSLGFFSRPTHSYPNEASAVDAFYLNFFRDLKERQVLNNTFIVFFGDHGARVGLYRWTYEGSIEERAANMVIYVPPWFRQKYPKLYQNLLTNRNRLTTNFDVHRTLQCIARSDFECKNLRSVDANSKGFSLFTEISPDRICSHATIPLHFCMCNGGVPVEDELVEEPIGDQVVKEINSITSRARNKCGFLRLQEVLSLTLLSGGVRWTARYRIVLKTEPGGGVFEATVEYIRHFLVYRSIRVVGVISRISKYKGLSDCVEEDEVLKLYCYCNNLSHSTIKGFKT